MSYGEQSAKKHIVSEANELLVKTRDMAADIQNGSAGDVKTHGRMLGLLAEGQSHIISMLTPMYMAEFVTRQDCDAIHKDKGKTASRIKIGPFEYQGPLTSIFMIFLLSLAPWFLFFVYGKQLAWW
jgi:hypothetical protein